jgi:hypothetical protein
MRTWVETLMKKGEKEEEECSLYFYLSLVPPSLPPTFASGKTLVIFKLCNSFCDEQ